MTTAEVRTLTARAMFAAPGQQLNGLEAVPEGLWLSDQRNNRTYLIDYAGTVLTSFPSPARNASGTSAGGGWVWVASNTSPATIFRHDPQTGHCTAAVILPQPEQGGVHGIQWRPYERGERPPTAGEAGPELHPSAPGGRPHDGPGTNGTLWVTRPGALRIDHIDAETGDLLRQIPFAATRSHGMFWDEADNTLSVAETNHGHVYRLDPHDGTVRDEWRIVGLEVHAMTRSADGRIWIGDAAQNTIFAVEP